MLFFTNNRITKRLLFFIIAFCLPFTLLAQEAGGASPEISVGKYQMMRYVLTGMIVLMLFVIGAIGSAVISATKAYAEREQKNKGSIAGKIYMILFLFCFAYHVPVRAQEVVDAAAAIAPASPGLPLDVYFLIVVLALEFVIVLVLAGVLQKLLKPKQVAVVKPAKKIDFKEFFKKVNQSVAIEDEDTIDLHHEYDGIRELDNKIPVWWQVGFALCILFGVVYLYRMFVAETLPDQIVELNEANKFAAIEHEAYLKNAADNVDENTVKMLDAAGIESGGALFAKNCVACHGDKGQGGVGPNLTDDYWLHGGDIKHVFHTVTFGWPEKGMKPWKDDFSPAQIAQLASYVKSLKGTHPPSPKEPQGELYTETPDAAATSGTDTAIDTTK